MYRLFYGILIPLSISLFFSLGSVVLVSPFKQCYKASVLCHAPKEVQSNPFDGKGIKMVGLIFNLSFMSIMQLRSFYL